MMAKFLKMLGKVWLIIAALLIFMGYASIWYRHGFSELMEVLSPFNIWNLIAVLVTIAPGIGLIKLGERLDVRKAGDEL
jgi:hypothetical protein